MTHDPATCWWCLKREPNAEERRRIAENDPIMKMYAESVTKPTDFFRDATPEETERALNEPVVELTERPAPITAFPASIFDIKYTQDDPDWMGWYIGIPGPLTAQLPRPLSDGPALFLRRNGSLGFRAPNPDAPKPESFVKF
jgi:hypothetical protein